MTPEASRFLQNADNHLERGQTMLAVGLSYDTGRAAYLAAFHAAQAVIFERSGKVLPSAAYSLENADIQTAAKLATHTKNSSLTPTRLRASNLD